MIRSANRTDRRELKFAPKRTIRERIGADKEMIRSVNRTNRNELKFIPKRTPHRWGGAGRD